MIAWGTGNTVAIIQRGVPIGHCLRVRGSRRWIQPVCHGTKADAIVHAMTFSPRDSAAQVFGGSHLRWHAFLQIKVFVRIRNLLKFHKGLQFFHGHATSRDPCRVFCGIPSSSVVIECRVLPFTEIVICVHAPVSVRSAIGHHDTLSEKRAWGNRKKFEWGRGYRKDCTSC